MESLSIEQINKLQEENEELREATKKIKNIVFDAEQKLRCCCGITDMLVEIESITDEVLK